MQLTWQLRFKSASSAQEGPRSVSLSLCKHSQLFHYDRTEFKNAIWGKKTNLLQKCLNPPKFIIANKDEVRLDEMFESMQQVKAPSVVTAWDTNKLNYDW